MQTASHHERRPIWGSSPRGHRPQTAWAITEIYYNTAGSDERVYECVEIYNNTGAAIDFSATPWVIDDANSTRCR